MGFGFAPRPANGLNASMMGDASHMMGAATDEEKAATKARATRQVALTPGGWQVNGTSVASSEWQPDPGEHVRMIGPDDKGYWTRDMGAFEWRGRPPSAQQDDASGLPGVIQQLVRHMRGGS